MGPVPINTVPTNAVQINTEGGSGGGSVVVTGSPEQVATCEKSYTGQFLKPLLK